jgi:hypothetical protein
VDAGDGTSLISVVHKVIRWCLFGEAFIIVYDVCWIF